MDDLEPMRPVHAAANETQPGSTWLLLAWFAAMFAVPMALILAPPSPALAVVSALAVCAGGGLAVAGTVRTLRENRGHRVPWVGRPPVRPRKWDLLSGSGMPLACFGTVAFGSNVDGLPSYAPVFVVGVLAAALMTAQAVHNRRAAAG